MAAFTGIKNKIQGLIDKSNAKTGRTDTDLTTAVDSLVDGYGTGNGTANLGHLYHHITTRAKQEIFAANDGYDGYDQVFLSMDCTNFTAGNIKKGVQILDLVGTYEGGGECSGKHIIEVDELPETGEEGAVYKILGTLIDVVYYYGSGSLSYADFTSAMYYVKSKPTEDIKVSSDAGFYLYYVEDENDVFTYEDSDGTGTMSWMALGCIGTITDISQATEAGCYAIIASGPFCCYENGEWVQYSQVINESLEFISNGDGTCYVSGIGTCTNRNVVIPSVSPDGDTVTEIGDEAFGGQGQEGASFKSVTIPDTVTRIGDYAFCNCKGLMSVEFGNSVTSIGTGAFKFCWSLCSSITIPDSVTSIGESAFYECTALESVTIGSGVTSIPTHAFEECRTLTSVTIGSGVTNIDAYAFQGCLALKIITIPDTVTSLGGNYIFFGCKSLTRANIGGGITRMPACTFATCTALETITFSGTMKQWNNITFDNENWKEDILATKVSCSDGTVTITEVEININSNGGHDVTGKTKAIVNIPLIIEADELPTENISTSTVYKCGNDLYRYEGTLGSGYESYVDTWVIDYVLPTSNLQGYIRTMGGLAFTSNGQEWTSVKIDLTSGTISYYNETQGMVEVYRNGCWLDEGYRTLIVTTFDISADPYGGMGSFSEWIDATARKQSTFAWNRYRINTIDLTPISFTIGTYPFFANSGMTWLDWLATVFNTDSFTNQEITVDGTTYNAIIVQTVDSTHYVVVVDPYGNIVKATDTIVSGHAYTTTTVTV